jgi:chemotaxis regulatin CheY-phosphate phosphatase CheZ
MNNQETIDNVMEKIEELKASLKFSNDMVPLITDVFRFITDIVPLLIDANFSIKETNNQIPAASDNLAKVSATTEMAANEVMDKLEGISEKLEVLKKSVKNREKEENLIQKIDEVENDAAEIVYSFQFQDITTQQIQHVEQILQAINEKFGSLFKSFTQLKEGSGLGSDIYKAIEEEIKNTIEKEHKDFFAERTEDKIRSSGISQDMIDSLFK